MEKNKILVLVTILFLIILTVFLIVRGQWNWGMILVFVVLASLFWRMSQKK
jgi:hypothetical protein